MSHQIVMLVLVPVQIYSTLVLRDLQRFAGTVKCSGDVRVVNTIHVVLCIVFIIFILVHVCLTTLGRTASQHTRAMLTGYEEVDEHHEPAPGSRGTSS